jgi:hypothetical protein
LTALVRTFTLPAVAGDVSCAVKERTVAKKRRTSRRTTQTTRRTGGRGASLASRRRRLGINLEPILAVLSVSIARLQRQIPAFAKDPRKTKALQRSIERLTTVRDSTQAICPNEILWFGVPVRGEKRSGE